MNMSFSLARRALVLPCLLACLSAQATLLEPEEIPAASSAQLRAAYLECDRLSSMERVDGDLMLACQHVGEVLKARDFGGSLERQLQWWRVARTTYRGGEQAGSPTQD